MITKVIGFALYGPLAASHRVRLGQYREGLAKAGINLQVQGLLGDDYLNARFEGKSRPIIAVLKSALERIRLIVSDQRFDAAIVYCELFPFTPAWIDISSLNIPYIYDFDDAFYLRYRVGGLAKLGFLLGGKIDEVIGGASAVTAGNDHLAAYARTFNENVVVLPSAVDTKYFVPRARCKSSTFTIGWVGSPSTARYLEALVRPLQTLAKDLQLRLIVIGGKSPFIEGVEILELPWSESTEVPLINTFDVGVMPLLDDEWARGKCAYKLVQYMACGVPVVASRIGANITLVTADCGFLVSSANQWVDAIRQLYGQPFLRKQMGVSARRRVIDYYSLERNLPILSSVIHKVVGI